MIEVPGDAYGLKPGLLGLRVMSGRRSGESSIGTWAEPASTQTSGAERAPMCGMSAGARTMTALAAASNTLTRCLLAIQLEL